MIRNFLDITLSIAEKPRPEALCCKFHLVEQTIPCRFLFYQDVGHLILFLDLQFNLIDVIFDLRHQLFPELNITLDLIKITEPF